MAEVCLESSKICQPSTRAARRRRTELRRLKFVTGAESMACSDELRSSKRKKNQELVEKASDNESNSSSDTDLNQSLRYGMTSICGRRRDMEDAVSIHTDFLKTSNKHHFFGVFDGHGGSRVADSCRDRMHELVKNEVESLGSSSFDWKQIMENSFFKMDGEMSELQTSKCDHVGSTAVVSVVTSDRVVVANCGDSRAVLGRKGAALPLSVDHKPDRPDELQRIEAAGGRVIYWDGARVLGWLAMSRAIGDGYLKPFVVSEPEVSVTERTEDDECLILASDGLWDVVSNETACDVVRMCLKNSSGSVGEGDAEDKACSDAAMLLTRLALGRGSSDNISVVVVDLRKKL